MQQAGKIITVTLMLVIVSACASSRKKRSTTDTAVTSCLNNDVALGRVVDNNIVAGGFIIQKGSIELRGTPVEGEFGFNAKVNSAGDIVLSVRGPLGIELIRIFAVGNEICVIERLGKTVYLGRKDEILKRYGMPGDFAEILFGDLPATGFNSIDVASQNRIVVEYSDSLHRRIATICTEEDKICSQSVISSKPEGTLEFIFADFRISDGVKFPGEIVIEENKRMFHVKLRIQQMTGGYEAPIELQIPSYKRKAL